MRSAPVEGRIDATATALAAGLEKCRAIATLPLLLAYRVTDQRELIDADVAGWLAVIGATGDGRGLHSLLYAFREFRSLFYWRLQCGNGKGALAAKVMRGIWKGVDSLMLSTRDIGPGLFIAHGHGTSLSGSKIGANCYVHQGVTIGWDYRSERTPIIGDNVFIGAGAVIVGAVTIGDGARIGANAVVLSDVPPGATAVGVPARVLPEPDDCEKLQREAATIPSRLRDRRPRGGGG